jgi:hypothetical protein
MVLHRPVELAPFSGVARRSLCSLAVGEARWRSCVFRCSSTSALWLILQFGSHNYLHAPGWLREASSLVFGRNRGLGELTTSYRAEQGKKLFATSVLFFSQGLTWFGLDSPGGIFTFRPLNRFDAFFRAEIVIGAIVAAYGMLVWRSSSRKLSVANYIIVLSCVAVLLPCVSQQSEWVYFLNRQRGLSILNEESSSSTSRYPFVSWFWVLGGPTVHTCMSGFTNMCDPADSSNSSPLIANS